MRNYFDIVNTFLLKQMLFKAIARAIFVKHLIIIIFIIVIIFIIIIIIYLFKYYVISMIGNLTLFAPTT